MLKNTLILSGFIKMQNAKTIVLMMFKDCMNYFDDSFYSALLSGGVSAFLYFLICVCRDFSNGVYSKKNSIRKSWKIPLVALLGFYCCFVLHITIFSREKGTGYILHLTPFSTWGTDFWHLKLWIENILMLMPLGILLYTLWQPFRKIGWSVLTGFLCSLAIECIQLLGQLGKFELDDIVNNVAGMLLGFGFCKGIGRTFLLFSGQFFRLRAQIEENAGYRNHSGDKNNSK